MSHEEHMFIRYLADWGNRLQEVYTGDEQGDDVEQEMINRITLNTLLEKLTPMEQEAIIMWSRKYPIREIAQVIGEKYDERDDTNPLSVTAMRSRILKILEKLKNLANS